ncbi:hypothetical protein [Streptomyces buecherae]
MSVMACKHKGDPAPIKPWTPPPPPPPDGGPKKPGEKGGPR